MQLPIFSDMVFRSPGMSEDCLFLNLWRPPQASNAPVMVWVHGGSLRTGNPANGLNEGSALAREGGGVQTLEYEIDLGGRPRWFEANGLRINDVLNFPPNDPGVDPTTGRMARRVSFRNAGSAGIATVIIRESSGVDDLSPSNATKVEALTIGAHQGRRLEFPEGHCDIDLAITQRSTVSVSVLVSGQVAQACALAVQAATLIEPKLPRG